jgi:hypothetical protein
MCLQERKEPNLKNESRLSRNKMELRRNSRLIKQLMVLKRNNSSSPPLMLLPQHVSVIRPSLGGIQYFITYFANYGYVKTIVPLKITVLQGQNLDPVDKFSKRTECKIL